MSTLTLILQSNSTGRFLLVEKDNEWHFPCNVPIDMESAPLFSALHECSLLTGLDSSDWCLDVVSTRKNQIFLATIDQESNRTSTSDWFSLYDFPENVSEEVARICEMRDFMVRTFQSSI